VPYQVADGVRIALKSNPPNLPMPLHHRQYKDSTGRIPDFKIEPEIALELLIASKYLDC
jgi:hypothetical protein